MDQSPFFIRQGMTDEVSPTKSDQASVQVMGAEFDTLAITGQIFLNVKRSNPLACSANGKEERTGPAPGPLARGPFYHHYCILIRENAVTSRLCAGLA